MRYQPSYLAARFDAPEKVDKIPSTLNWDLFTGPAKLRPFNKTYHPWNWRDGGIMVQVRWVIWLATSYIRYSKA